MGFFDLSTTQTTKKGTTKGFYFGKPEAEAEFSIKGQSLSDYFEDFLGVKRQISEGKFIITGRKGTGKSAIAQYFKNESQNKENDLYTSIISPRDIELDKVIQGLPDVDISLIFEWNILTRLIKLIIDADRSDYAEHLSDLKKFYNRNQGAINIANFRVEEISAKTEVGIDILRSKLGGMMGKKFKEMRFSKAPFYDFIPALREILLEVLQYDVYKECVFLLEFDELDIDFKIRTDADKILKLVRVARDYNTKYFKGTPFKLLVFIRDDVKDFISSADKTKLFNSYECCIRWYDYDDHIRDEKEILLRKFINKRIKANFEKYQLKYNITDPWSTLFDTRERYDGKSVFEYILGYTFYRPRDFVNLLSPLGELEYRYPLNGTAISSLINKMAIKTMGDLEDELSILYELNYITSIKRLIKCVCQAHPPISYNKLMAFFEECNVDKSDLYTLIDYDILVLSQDGNFKHKYREQRIEDDIQNYEFSIHKAIYIYFNKLR